MSLRSPRTVMGVAFGILVLAVAALLVFNQAPHHQLVVDGQVLGAVHDARAVKSTVARLAAVQEEETGLEMAPAQSIQLAEMRTLPRLLAVGQTLDDERLEATLAHHVTFLARGIEIRVDGEPLVVVRNAETGREVLAELERRHLAALREQSESIEIHAVSRIESVDFRESEVQAEDVHDVDEALELLSGGHEAEVVHRVQGGESLFTIAARHDVSVAELQEANPQMTNANVIRAGDTLRLTVPAASITFSTEETITVIEDVPFETEVRQDGSLWNWQRVTRRQGQPGERRVTYNIVRQGDEIIEQEELESELLKDPVNRIVAQGTRAVKVLRTGQLYWPAHGRISSHYGPRWGGFHAGLDIANNTGSPIMAAESGRVTATGWRGSYGLTVIINHGEGVSTLYAHLSQIRVSTGQWVSGGQVIGLMGATGRATGPHLHFEVRLDGTPTNPLPFLR